MTLELLTLLKEWGSTGAVIFITLAFLKQLKSFGTSRDEERKAFTDAITAERTESMQAIMRVVDLARAMVDGCQRNIPQDYRVTGNDVMAAGTIGKKGGNNRCSTS